MNRTLFKRLSVLLTVLLLWSTLALSVHATDTEKNIHFVALGDSYAAGTLYDLSAGKGYNDVIAGYLEAQGKLASYTKDFAKNGAKTTDVLLQLKDEKVMAAIKNSNFVTLSIGGNDVLNLVSIDKATGNVNVDFTKVPAALEEMGKQLAQIVVGIKTISPEADVYVFGYPFAFPHAEGTLQKMLAEATNALNTTIKLAVQQTGATYIDIDFGDKGKLYLPNPVDIHPSEDGYKSMAEQFLKVFNAPKFTLADVPENHWAATALYGAVQNGLLVPSEDGFVYPNQALTRAEAAMALVKFVPMKQDVPKAPDFKDVPAEHPAYMAIAALTDVGVFSNGEMFHPNAPLTRAQAAKVLALAFHLEKQGNVPFTDVASNHWAYDHIQVVASNGLIRGFSNGSYQPAGEITRAQFAVIASRILALSMQ
ncbi:S-layer homology domain-containing protein [Anaerobacillus alkaliphilus]|nr:S-layer homology domain-containing protein [Anaerobacillus alkaliphilus]